MEAGKSEGTPEALDTPGKRAIYNNLPHCFSNGGVSALAEPASGYGDPPADEVTNLALRVDRAVREARPDGWRGVQAREQVIKGALYRVLKDAGAVEHLFRVIKAQNEY